MHAYFDAQDGNPKVVIEIKGSKRAWKTVSALLDTGHNGSLSLPLLDLIEIGAKLSSVGTATYANGHDGVVYYFTIKVRIDGIEKKIEASMIENPGENEAIAGLELFAPYVAVIDFGNKRVKFTTGMDPSIQNIFS